jgi:hypothetical protein
MRIQIYIKTAIENIAVLFFRAKESFTVEKIEYI